MCEHLSTGMEMNTFLHMPGPVSCRRPRSRHRYAGSTHTSAGPAPRAASGRGEGGEGGGRVGAAAWPDISESVPRLKRGGDVRGNRRRGGGGVGRGGGCACKVPSGPMTPLGPAPGPACTSRRSRSSLPPLSLMKAAAAACIPPRPSPLPTHGRLWGHTQSPRPAAKKSHPVLRTSYASLVPARPGPARPIIFDFSCT